MRLLFNAASFLCCIVLMACAPINKNQSPKRFGMESWAVKASTEKTYRSYRRYLETEGCDQFMLVNAGGMSLASHSEYFPESKEGELYCRYTGNPLGEVEPLAMTISEVAGETQIEAWFLIESGTNGGGLWLNKIRTMQALPLD